MQPTLSIIVIPTVALESRLDVSGGDSTIVYLDSMTYLITLVNAVFVISYENDLDGVPALVEVLVLAFA